MDFIIQLKPYLAFFCVYHIAPKFTGWQRKLLKDLSLLIWFCLCFLGVSQLFVRDILVTVMGHPTVLQLQSFLSRWYIYIVVIIQ